MRLFVAITPPRSVLLEVRAAVDSLVRSNGIPELHQLRWTRPDTWHITLAFYGEVDEEKLSDLSERLGRVAARTTPIELSLAGAGRFGPRVVWFGVQGQCDRLGRLAEAAGAAARRCHIRVEDRPYRPHLTLARVNGVPRSRPGGDEAVAGPVDLVPVVERLRAFRSPGWLAGDIELFHVVETVDGLGPAGQQPFVADGNGHGQGNGHGTGQGQAQGSGQAQGHAPHVPHAHKRYVRIGHWPLTGR
jgi:RNA 2',3'-cyclic 3'-phosphodiesterase